MLKYFFDRSLFSFDLLFVASVAGAIFINHNITLVITLLSCAPLAQLAMTGKLKMPSKLLLGVAGVFLVYLVTVQILTVVHPGLPPGVSPTERYFFPDQLHLLGIAIVLIGALRVENSVDLFKAMRIALPPTMLLIFAALTYDMFKSATDPCRVVGLTFMPFTPASFFSSLTLLSFAGWSRLSRAERAIRYALISMSIVVVAAYTGSRGVAMALTVCLAVMLLFSLIRHRSRATPKALFILVSILIGLLSSAAVEQTTGCHAITRFTGTFDSVGKVLLGSTDEVQSLSFSEIAAPATSEPNTAGVRKAIAVGTEKAVEPAIFAASATDRVSSSIAALSDASISLRLQFWNLGWESFMASPWLGHGIFVEPVLLSDEFGFTHVHNQYLSWLLWGGVPMLVLGLGFVFALVFFVRRAAKFDALAIVLATSAMLAISLATDSFLRFDVYIAMHILMSLIGVALSVQFSNENGHDSVVPP